MRVAVIGGIFDKPAEYRARHSMSPETVLADGLRRRGWEVVTCGHHARLHLQNCDLVHAHHFGKAALHLASAPRRIPFLLTTHDPFAMNGLSAGWRRRLTDPFVLLRANAVIALSNAEREFLERRRGLPGNRIAVIPNGVNGTVFERMCDAGDHELLFVGQLEEFKGLDYLLDALPAVRVAHPQVRLRLAYQTASLLDRYRSQVQRLGLSGCVEFLGAKTAAGLAELYSAATVVISPSLGECLSTVVLEAMSCGAAVVATDVGGIHEQLDENTGVIVPRRDSPALARAICALLENAGLRKQLGQAAQRKVRSQFSVRQMIDRHITLYEDLLDAKQRAA